MRASDPIFQRASRCADERRAIRPESVLERSPSSNGASRDRRLHNERARCRRRRSGQTYARLDVECFLVQKWCRRCWPAENLKRTRSLRPERRQERRRRRRCGGARRSGRRAGVRAAPTPARRAFIDQATAAAAAACVRRPSLSSASYECGACVVT